jgi:hypothetical protein
VTTFAMASRVRLTPERQAAQPDIGDAIGVVFGDDDGAVEVEWPRPRLHSWHKAGDLEPAR